MLCLKKRRTYSFTQGVCTELPRRSKEDNHRYQGSLNMAITTLPRKNRTREERPSRMVLTVTEDTPADMLAGSMELLVQLPQEHHLQTQRVTVQRSMPMMDLLVQIATAHKLTASSYTLQAIGERGIVLPHQPNTPIGALDALQVKLLPKQGTFVPRKSKQVNQPFETTFRLQVHLPRNQLWVSRVSPKMNLGEILDQVCREKDLDKNKYELRHPASLETLDLSLSLQDYHLQEVTLYAKQGRSLGSALSTQDIMALQRQEERRRQQAKQGVFGFVFKKSKEGSLSTDSLGGRSASPARSDETGRSTSPLQPPTRPQRKRRPAPKPPIQAQADVSNGTEENCADSSKDKVVISHSRNSSDSSGYHEASVLSDNPDSAGRLPETLPRRNKVPLEMPRKLAQTSQSSKSLSNLTSVPGTLSHGISSTSLSSTGLRKKRVAPPPPVTRPLSSAISTQALERIVDSEESLTSDMDPSKPPSDISVPSKANSDIEERPKASSDIGVTTLGSKLSNSIDFTNPDSSKVELELKGSKCDIEPRHRSGSINVKLPSTEPGHPAPVEDAPVDSRLPRKRDTNLSETDVLLQKVSDTLSNSLPVASFDEVPVSPTVTELEPTNISKETDQKNKKISEYSNGFDVNISSANLTVNSQQDTSDYVSAVDEDLSVTDWEYQLPAPPSAFRDSASPVFDNFEVITPSPESFRDTEITELTSTSNQKDGSNIIEKVEMREIEVRKETPHAKSFIQRKPESSMKKEVICELENKISTLPQNTMSQKDMDSRRSSNPSTAKISPVDNTLSNFTITTYSKQKNLNIFEEVEQSRKTNSDERFIKSFATLTRNKSNLDENEDKNLKEFSVGTLQGKKKVTTGEDKLSETKLEPKIQTESLQRWQSGNEKSNIQRSKSYMSMCDKSNLQGNVCEIESIKNEKNLEMDDSGMKKATSISNLSVTATKNDEKSSQWRDNILKRPTKEKQLQSVQVLKSILPQLKNAQQAEENVPKDSSDIVLSEKTRSETTSNEHSTESNEVSTREPQTAPSNKKVESESKKPTLETNKKRYTYSGPPMINLGSWSERPSVNVQIKKDIDYKFGVKQTNSSTIVNINSSKDEVDSNNINSSTKIQKSKFEFLDKKEPNELTKKLISHTTATGFKKPVLNKVNNSEAKVTNDKPVVTGVELKKSFLENKQDDNVIDTTPVNFKELTKAFGQDVCLRPKPKRSSTIQRSDSQLENDSSKQNGHRQDQCLINGYQNIKPKRFSSIVGIQNEGNLTFRNGLSIKGHQPMPVVKGFKISNTKIGATQSYENQTKEGFKEDMKEDNIKGSSKDSNSTPRPPTMPVITGVTLKSARPKSMPIQIDQRDVLLESIRNFGGRENLKSAMERC
ncbi:cordon-bleu protein-like 1 isoform X10 [Bombus pyrosoma]|uniref:cordon-bleu protein-like 1 isoform X10 n=1 Tax=Bombus pyrosoma TaxID=396416 RepID=UPI001CB891B0|nr:cordon-bleu protein-like 1 isoform X10 [Bombus pyrosoma]